MKNNFNIKNIFGKVLKSRGLKYGSNSLIMIVAVIALAVVVNMLVDLTKIKWDLTPEKIFSIGDTTYEILDNLDKDVEIIGLVDESKINDSNDLKEINEILNQYEKRSSHIKVRYVDPDKNPGIYKDIDPDELKDIKANDYVIKCGNKIKVVNYYDMFDFTYTQDFQSYVTGSNAEPAITGAIKYVTAEYTPTIYFLTGHSEMSIDKDYSVVKEYLDRNNYDVKEINLLTEEKVPDDAQMIIVASPQKDLAQAERERLIEYMDKGGNAIMMFDPIDQDPDLANFQSFLQGYGVSLNYDIIRENEQSRFLPPNRNTDLVPIIQSTDVTSDLASAGIPVLVPRSRSINILKNTKEYIKVNSMMKTSDVAVGELIDASRGQNIQGPLNIAVSVLDEGGYEPSKLIVFGDGDFLSDSVYEGISPYGIYVFFNSIQWMTDEREDEVMILPKKYEQRRLEITQLEANVMAAVVMIVLPLIILGLGVYVWVRRRHL